MSVEVAAVGVCKTLFVPLNCDGTINESEDLLWSCTITDVERTPQLGEGLSLKAASGMPGRNCLTIEIPGQVENIEVKLTTCGIFSSRLDALTGMSDETPDGLGSMAKKFTGGFCACECGDVTCLGKMALATVSLAYCAGTNVVHPDGKFVWTVYPKLEFRPTADTSTTNKEINPTSYTAYAFENEAFGAGPDLDEEEPPTTLLPAAYTPYDRAYYMFVTDQCPPDVCACGTCVSAEVEPEAFAGRVAGGGESAAIPTGRMTVGAPSDG